jgi:hypothetical protein
MLRLKRSFQIGLSDSNTVESVRLKYQQQLQLLKFRTDLEPYGFSFRRKFRAEYPDEHREEVFSVFREGGISIYTGINRINGDWSVKLDILFFISFFVGIFFGIAMNMLLNYSLTLLVITSLLGFLASVVSGIVVIFLKIDAINNSCLMND